MAPTHPSHGILRGGGCRVMSAAPVVGPPRPTIEVPSPAGRILGVGAGVLVASPTARNPNALGYSTWPTVPDGRQPWPSQFPRSATNRTRRRNILYIKSYLRQSSQSQMKRSATCQGCSQSGGQKEAWAVGSEPTGRRPIREQVHLRSQPNLSRLARPALLFSLSIHRTSQTGHVSPTWREYRLGSALLGMPRRGSASGLGGSGRR